MPRARRPRAVPATRPQPRRRPATPPTIALLPPARPRPVGRWAHEPPSTPCDPRCARTRCRLHGAARGPARRLPAPATDRIGGAGRRVPGRRRGGTAVRLVEGDDGGAAAAALLQPPRRRCPRGRRRRASSCCGSTTPTCQGSRSPASSRRCRRMPRARCPGPRRGIARRRPVLPRRGATRRARAVAHHRRAHPEPG